MTILERDRRALFELMLAEAGLAHPAAQEPAAAIPRRTAGGPAPLSFAQQRLWFLDQLEPESPAYSVAAALRLTGNLNPDRLTRAFERIVERHEVLQTVFDQSETEPVQRVETSAQLTLTLVDLSAAEPVQQRRAVEERAVGEASTPFDLRTGPLLRLVLARLGPDDCVLLLTMHHIVSDQWSLGIMARELATFYTDPEAEIAAPPVQYADYATWQRTWRASAAFDDHLAWWRRELEGAIPLQLAPDHPRPAAPSHRGAPLGFSIDAGARRSVEAIGQSAGATPFMTLLALFTILLARRTGQADVAVGTPVANRADRMLEDLVGFFTNTIVLRTPVIGALPLTEYIAAVRDRCLAAYQHDAMPFEALVEALNPERDLSRHPFFDVMFVLQTALPALDIPGLHAEFADQPVVASKFDLTLTVREEGGGWFAWFEYATELFERATVDGLARQFRALLVSAVGDPRSRVDDLPLMSVAERDHVVHGLNDTRAAFDGDGLVHRLFEAQVRRTPDADAVAYGDVPLTYRGLDERANRLARHLMACGAGPDVPIGICLPRSLDLVVTVLAVLKAGAAYVPLDPAYPIGRLEYMLADSGAGLVLVDDSTSERFASNPARRIVNLVVDRRRIETQPSTAPAGRVAADNLLYFIYTSGSTGRPKGAALTHRALHNLIRWHLETLLIGVATLQFAPLSFDASFHEMFAALASGGTLHVAEEAERTDIDRLVAHLERDRIAKVILPVVVFRQLSAIYADRRERFPTLREIAVTGEPLLLTPAILAFCAGRPHVTLHNHYGPSETHVVTAYTFAETPSRLLPPPPIGRPIANTDIHLLDGRLNAVPMGVAAELYVGGTNLARGYHGRPDLTAERFVPHPFMPGERLYRTGDLARWTVHWQLEFLGRLDAQVKVRGFRVEPGEVETALANHPSVAQSAVAVREVVPGSRDLVAFVVPAAGSRVDADGLGAFLGATLPAHLVPSHFVALDALPLTPSGKVDRRALPTPAPASDARYEAPSRDADRWMAARWAELLGLDRVGLHDHFFRLGGHSLVATRLVSRLRHTLEIEVPVKLLFEQPTLGPFVTGLASLAGGRARLDAIAATLLEVEALSADEARALLDHLRATES